MPRRLLVGIGDNCVDRYLDRPGQETAGGNVFNVVANCLKRGIPAVYVGSVGDDADGRLISGALRALGGDLRFLRVVPGSTGVSTIAPAGRGESRVVAEQYGVSGTPPVTPDLVAWVESERPLVHCSTNGRALFVARALRGSGVSLSCDLGEDLDDLAPSERTELLASVDYAFRSVGPALSDDEVGAMAERLTAEGPEAAVLSRGARGVWCRFGAEVQAARPHPVEAVVDTLGAGDALIAGMLSSILEGGSVRQHVQRGLFWAAEAVSHWGAI